MKLLNVLIVASALALLVGCNREPPAANRGPARNGEPTGPVKG